MSYRKRVISFVYLFGAFCILIAPLLLRLTKGNPILGGEAAYHQLRLAGDLIQGNVYWVDSIVVGGSTAYFSPFTFLVGFLLLFFQDWAAIIIPSLFAGLLTAYGMRFFLSCIDIDDRVRNVTLVLFLASPLFLGLSINGSLGLALGSILLGMGLLVKSKKKYLAYFLIAIAALSGIAHSLVIIFASIVFIFWFKEKRYEFGTAIFISFFIFCAIHLPWILIVLKFPSASIEVFRLTRLVADFGSLGVFSLFTALLSWIGTWLWWVSKPTMNKTLLVFSIEIASWFVQTQAYALIAGSVLAAYLFVLICDMKWPDIRVHQAMILLIALGVLFSAISFSVRLSSLDPSSDQIKDLTVLKELTKESDVIFSDASQGVWIQSVANRNVWLDSSYKATDPNVRLNLTNQIYDSFDLKATVNYLGVYNSSYIYLSESMINMYWDDDEQKGLIFLLENNESFKRIYNPGKHGIWRINYN